MRISDWSSDVCSSDLVTDYEIGAKYSWRNGPLRGLVSFDVYRDNFDNAQRNVTQPVNGNPVANVANVARIRSEEHTSELQSLTRISYAVFCLKKKKNNITLTNSILSYNILRQIYISHI